MKKINNYIFINLLSFFTYIVLSFSLYAFSIQFYLAKFFDIYRISLYDLASFYDYCFWFVALFIIFFIIEFIICKIRKKQFINLITYNKLYQIYLVLFYLGLILSIIFLFLCVFIIIIFYFPFYKNFY